MVAPRKVAFFRHTVSNDGNQKIAKNLVTIKHCQLNYFKIINQGTVCKMGIRLVHIKNVMLHMGYLGDFISTIVKSRN